MNDILEEHSQKITDLMMSGADPDVVEKAVLESRDAIDAARDAPMLTEPKTINDLGLSDEQIEQQAALYAAGIANMDDRYISDDPEVPPMTRAEVNAFLISNGLEPIPEPIPDPNDKDIPSFMKNNGQVASIFRNWSEPVVTHRGPSRDRSLSGKARRKARKGS